jgi:hypothetical protein
MSTALSELGRQLANARWKGMDENARARWSRKMHRAKAKKKAARESALNSRTK